MNFIQKSLQCCGIENSTDWEMNRPPSSTQQDFIPDSCCKSEFGRCNKNDPGQLQEQGCGEAILNWSIKHTYMFLLLWLLLVLLSVLFCYLLRKLSEGDDDNQAVVSIKPILSDNESENLMSTNKKVLDYQDTFKECNQIVYPTTISPDYSSKEDINSNLTKLTKYSQIKYSKVKATNSIDNLADDDNVELTCHQDKELNDLNLERFKKYDCDSLDNLKKNKNINKSTNSIKSDVKLDKEKGIKNVNKKINPNYDPNYDRSNDLEYHCDTPSENSSSENSSNSDDNSKLIHSNNK